MSSDEEWVSSSFTLDGIGEGDVIELALDNGCYVSRVDSDIIKDMIA